MSILKLKDSQGNWVGVPTVKGDKGNGISSAVLNNDYTLTLTFTDGTTYTTPSIRGEKGEQGEPATDMDIHICSITEYDANTRVPTIENPNSSTFYLVPSEDGTSPDLFTEWVYVNNAWEMFGSASVDLSGYLTDVTVNGTSVVTDGVAEIPIASRLNLGVIKVDSNAVNSGLYVNDGNGFLETFCAPKFLIKNGDNTHMPIVPSNQHESTFYGLAKASGDTTQSESSNAVGNYTEEAKRAIRELLGLPRYTEAELIADVTTSEELASLTINTDVNGLPFEIRKAKIVVELKASTTGNADYFTATANCLTVLNEESSFSFATLKMESVNNSVMMYEFDAGEGVSTNRGYVRREIGLSTSAIGVMLYVLRLKYLKAFTFKRYGSTTSLIPIGTRIRIFGIRY